jgi:hypothetical protein
MLEFTQSDICDVSILDNGALKFYVSNKVSTELSFIIRQYRSRRGTGQPRDWKLILNPNQRGNVPLATDIELVEIWTEGEFVLSCITRGRQIESARLTQVQKAKPVPRAEVAIPLPQAIAGEVRTVLLPSRSKALVSG